MNDVAQIDNGNSTRGGLVRRMAERFGVDENKLLSTLKRTAFKVKNGEATNEQMMSLMVVADQYKLNPFTKEIYAFPDKQNGIVPVVGVDGWSRIINSHPEFDGLEFRYSDELVLPGDERFPGLKSKAHEWVECVMYRKDRAQPIVVREYLDEVYRPPFTGQGKNGPYTVEGPWQTHPKRFHRHKSLIQCSRIGFGFAGIYDQDEAERIHEAQSAEAVAERSPARPEREPYPDQRLDDSIDGWRQMIDAGQQTTDGIIAMIESRYTLTDQQRRRIQDLDVIDAETEGEGNENTES